MMRERTGILAEKIVKNRRIILPVMLAAALICALLSLKVEINPDMTRYLPANSSMKQGIDIMAEEFSSLSMPSTVRVMLRNLPEEKTTETVLAMQGVSGVERVTVTGRTEPDGEKDGYTLFTVSTPLHYRTDEERTLESELAAAGAAYDAVVRNDDSMGMDIPLHLYVIVVCILLAVLFAMCESWVEPFLFIGTIGVAILINLGTNLALGSVSQTTYSMAAILQLILSMDYSVILMNRYRQEKGRLACGQGKREKQEAGENTGSALLPGQSRDIPHDSRIGEKAMANALRSAFSSVASSGFTTFAGLLMLVFMQFKIGKDLGLVLAKGVLCSMLCVWLVLPCLILLSDRWIERTEKPSVRIHTKALAAFAWLFRYFLAASFILLFAASIELQRHSKTSYSLQAEDPIADVFPPANPIVVLYANEDEASASETGEFLARSPYVESVYSYGMTLGRRVTKEELKGFAKELMSDPNAAGMLGEETRFTFPDQTVLDIVYALSGKDTMSIEELFAFAADQVKTNALFSALVSREMKEQIDDLAKTLSAAKAQLVGEKHSLMMLQTNLPVESEETTAFICDLENRLGEEMTGDWYLIGNSPMNAEMERGFDRELLLITLLTTAAIFLVVLVTFRSLLIPVILVSLVQCGVFLTITTTWLLGYKIYYLAILIVQCILMGATVDYGILFTNYYRELRQTLPVKETLREAYSGSMHTILTSGLFMIFGTGTLGVAPVDPTIGQICQSISLGAASATILVIFVLPGILAAWDRLLVKRKKRDS